MSTTSFAVTPNRSSPSKSISIVFGFACGSVWVASTCSTSDVPMPNASAPNAPCVEVWLSPQTIDMPGWVSPSCGPTTRTLRIAHGVKADPELRAVAPQRVNLGPGHQVGDRCFDVDRRDVVVLGGDRQV